MATIGSDTPLGAEICMVTVDTTTNTNLILWKKPNDATIDHYNVYRETSQAGLYQLIDSVDYDSLTVYNDVAASPNIRSWRYKISTVNTCGIESALSAYHKTIHLSISKGLANSFNLAWDDYEGFTYPKFKLYRYTNIDGWVYLDSLPTNLYSYTNTPPTEDGLNYIIAIDSPNDCTPEKAQDYNSSRSNKCSGHMLQGTGNPTGIAEYNQKNEVQLVVYPNPSSGIVNFYWEGQNIQFTVLNVQGQQLFEGTLKNGTTQLDLSKLEPGVYFLKTQKFSSKLIIEHK
jgi:hypothetical protein